MHLIPATGTVTSAIEPPNVYLVVGERSVLIDAGSGQEEALETRLAYVKQVAAGLDLIIVSHAHPDHLGGVAWLKRATGARLAIHRGDAAWARSRFQLDVDLLLEDGETIDLGNRRLDVVHTPGHTPGHMCLYLVDDAVLFSGDQVVGTGTTAIESPHGDMATYVQSLRRLLGYQVRLICPGHGPLACQPQHRIEELIQQRLDRERQMLDCLKQAPAYPRELVARIYPGLAGPMVGIAQRHVMAHLLKLEGDGRIVRESGSWRIASGKG
ncbi:MAG: MBL fold metallo-hydrolase [Chloroflexi bacterium]|nr:MBL fold metallo-hydrolase [Chloroflexota bacterium]